MSIRSLFEDHPASVGETYWQHLASAWGFSWRMAVRQHRLPGACPICPSSSRSTGSQAITQLHDKMVTNRHRNPGQAGEERALQRERSAA